MIDFRIGQRVNHKRFGNGTVTAVNGEVVHIGFDAGGVRRIIKSFVDGEETPPPSRKSARGARRSTAGASKSPMIEEIEWFDAIKPVLTTAHIIKGFLDSSAMSVLYGPSNSGKTFFALDVAFHVAASLIWRKRRVNGGVVLYLAAEGGNGIANRIVGLKSILAEGVEVRLALRRAGLDLLHPDADVQRVIVLVEEISSRYGPVVLIVIDTLSRVLAGGDENGPVDMTAFVGNVDKIRLATGAHVLIVHHTGKDAARGARGHSSLRAATDTEIEVAVDDAGNRSASVTKQRDLTGGETFYFDLESVSLGVDQDGDEVTTCILVERDAPAGGDGTPPMIICKQMLKDIDDAWKAGNPLSASHQSKRSGRFVNRFLVGKYNVPDRAINKLLGQWLDNEILVTETINAKTKKSGLMVKNWLE